MEQLNEIITTSSDALPRQQPNRKDPTYPKSHGHCLSVNGWQLRMEMTTRKKRLSQEIKARV